MIGFIKKGIDNYDFQILYILYTKFPILKKKTIRLNYE